MAGVLLTPPIVQFFNNAGLPCVNGSVLTQVGGVNAATYQDSGLTTPLPNPIPLNSRGEVSTSNGVSSQCFLTPNTIYTMTLYDASGNQLWAASYVNGVQMNAASIGAALYPQTAGEAAASITPTVYTYPPGCVQRYGADPTGVAASDTAFTNAHLCNSLVFDSYPGGGKYLFNTGVTVTNFPINFLGQAKNNKDASGNAGTTFLLATAAGAGAAHFTFSYADNVRFQNIGFQWQSGNLSQFAIHVKTVGATGGQLRSSVFDSCAFVSSGAGDTNCGIRIDSGTGGAQYSAFNTIRECYFSALAFPIRLTGNSTPMRVNDCDFLGHGGVNSINALGAITPGAAYTNGSYFNVAVTGGSGTGAIANVTVSGGAVTAFALVYGGNNYANTDTVSVAAASIGGTGAGFSIHVTTVGNELGSAIQIDFPGEELKTRGNYFEGWTQGIYSNGGAILSHVTDDAQVCVYGYHWAQSGTHAFMGNVNYGFIGVNGVAIGYSNLDSSQIQTSGPFGTIATGGAIQSTRGFQEGTGAGTNLRAQLMGYFATIAPTLAANGGGTLSAITTTTFCSSLVGGTMTVLFSVSATLTGSATTAITMAIPAGLFPVVNTQAACSVLNNAASAFGLVYVTTSAAQINVALGANGSGAFTAGSIAFSGQITFRVIS